MSAIRRIISVSVASATVIGLIVPVGDAPPAIGCGMQRSGGERPAARRDAEYSVARAGCAADGPQAAGYER